ncbi:hypothetical protein ACIP2Y_44415 [Streptomyces sviceus]|uniref:hypothetical protein n=1 Tax=Streptomyces sviceus TaxID=285530 RepID=UPI00380B045D
MAGLHAAPTEVQLQQGDMGFPLDDVVAIDRSGLFEFVVEKQVKQTLKVAPGDTAWRQDGRRLREGDTYRRHDPIVGPSGTSRPAGDGRRATGDGRRATG